MEEKTFQINDFLDNIVYIINFERTEGCDEEKGHLAIYQIIEYYNNVIVKDDFFYEKLFDVLDNDVELYSLVTSAIYDVTKDAKAIVAIEDVLLNNEVEPYTADKILSITNVLKFSHFDIPNSYKKNRDINKKFLENFEEKYPCIYEYIPFEERKHNRIVIETNTLLEIEHAPTRMVLNICKWLQKDCGYEIFLIVNRSNSRFEDLAQVWNVPTRYNYRQDIEGRFGLNYDGVLINGFQFEWHKDKVDLKDMVLEFLYEWKPLCVYHIGSPSYRHDIYRKVTTLLSMPCNNGYIESEAQVLVSYINSKSKFVLDSLEYINNEKQIVKDIGPLGGLREPKGKNYSKKDLGIPESKFAACIVGNRLTRELSKDFIDMLVRIAREKDSIHYVIIGECPKDIFPYELQSRVTYLGYQEAFLDVMKPMDLFINPIRKGGGGGGVSSLQMGTPVVTLKGCDVHALVGDSFACENLEDMETTIIKHLDDEEFYNNQVELARKWLEMKKKRNSSSIFGKLMEDVKNDLMNNII